MFLTCLIPFGTGLASSTAVRRIVQNVCSGEHGCFCSTPSQTATSVRFQLFNTGCFFWQEPTARPPETIFVRQLTGR